MQYIYNSRIKSIVTHKDFKEGTVNSNIDLINKHRHGLAE